MLHFLPLGLYTFAEKGLKLLLLATTVGFFDRRNSVFTKPSLPLQETILAFSRNDWDWVEGGLRELGYDIEKGELKKLGLDNWAQREKERITGIVERNEYRGN